MEVLIFGNVTSSLIKAAILSSFGLFFGVVVYVLLVYPSMRRPQYRSPQGCPKRLAALVGLIITLAFTIASYFSSLSSFFEIELSPSQVALKYYYPPHSVLLSRNQIDRFDRRVEPTRAGRQIRLIVATDEGQVLESSGSRPEDFEPAYQRLEQWLLNR